MLRLLLLLLLALLMLVVGDWSVLTVGCWLVVACWLLVVACRFLLLVGFAGLGLSLVVVRRLLMDVLLLLLGRH